MIVLKQNKPLTKLEIDYLFRQDASWTRFEDRDGKVIGGRFKFIKHPNPNRSRRREQQRIEAKKKRQEPVYIPIEKVQDPIIPAKKSWFVKLIDWFKRLIK